MYCTVFPVYAPRIWNHCTYHTMGRVKCIDIDHIILRKINKNRFMSTKQWSENGNELRAMRKDGNFSVGIISKKFLSNEVVIILYDDEIIIWNIIINKKLCSIGVNLQWKFKTALHLLIPLVIKCSNWKYSIKKGWTHYSIE